MALTKENNNAGNLNNNGFRCPYCGTLSTIIWVHGHGQCDRCKINLDECCRGEDAACRFDAGETDTSTH